MSDVIPITGETFIPDEAIPPTWDDMLTSRPKPIFHRVSYPPRLSLNGLLIALLCTVLLVFIGFIQAPLPSPLSWGQSPQPENLIQYGFTIPLALFVGAFLGPFMGTAALVLYLGIGLFVAPIFANGGGLSYLLQPSFGYLLGGLMAGHFLANSFHRIFQKSNQFRRSLKLLSLTLASVLLVHTLGIAYLAGVTVLQQVPWTDFFGYVLRFSVEPFPYDLLATGIFLCMVRQIRLSLWWALY